MERKSQAQKTKLPRHMGKGFKRPKTRAEKRKELRDKKQGGKQDE